MRLRNSTLTALSLSALLFLFSFYHFLFVREQDVLSYQQLMHPKKASTSYMADKIALSLKENPPTRKKICKDVWTSRSPDSQQGRFHHRITSERSTLKLAPSFKEIHTSSSLSHFDIAENLEEICCILQDKSTPSSSSIGGGSVRILEANQGMYHFRTHRFTTEKAKMRLFKIASEILPSPDLIKEHALVQGEIQQASFILGGKIPQFHGKEFQMEVFSSP